MCQLGQTILNVRCSFSVDSTEFIGRFAAVGYSAVLMAFTGVDSPLSRTISRANPHQVVSPAAVRW